MREQQDGSEEVDKSVEPSIRGAEAEGRLRLRQQAADMIDAMVEAVGLSEDELDSFLREAGVDPVAAAPPKTAQSQAPSQRANAEALRSRIEGWIQNLIQTAFSGSTGSLMTAAARAGSSAATEPGSAKLVDEWRNAIELLAAGRYAKAQDLLVAMRAEVEQPETINWYLAHVQLGLGEVDEAKQLLATMGGDLQEQAEERLLEIEGLLGE